MKSNIGAFKNLLRRKINAGLLQAAGTHAAIYLHNVMEEIGTRPIPPVFGPPGNPYRSEPGQYPYVDPDTDEQGLTHGYEYISFGVRRSLMQARSGLEEAGMHLQELTEEPFFRLGMVDAMNNNKEIIAENFIGGARFTK